MDHLTAPQTFFDLAPADRTLPEWGRAADESVLTGQYTVYQRSLRDLERDFYIDASLADTVYEPMITSDELLKTVHSASYPLRKLRESTPVRALDMWEAIASIIMPSWIDRANARGADLIERGRARAADRKEKYIERAPAARTTGIKSFHIRDSTGESTEIMRKIISRVESQTNAQLLWSWLATYHIGFLQGKNQNADYQESRQSTILRAKTPENWVTGIDGTGFVSPANMRSWANRVETTLKSLDIIFGCSPHEDDFNHSVIFVLCHLSMGGSAIIYLPKLSVGSTLAMIHLFTQCFEKSQIYWTIGDTLFLCGTNFIGGIPARGKKLLYDYCLADTGSANLTPFTANYLTSESYVATASRLTEITHAIYTWRREFYEKMLNVYAKLEGSSAAQTFEGFITQELQDLYPDQSGIWVKKFPGM